MGNSLLRQGSIVIVRAGFFFTRQCPTTGGQVLFVKRQNWFRIWFEPMELGQYEMLIVGREGTAWEFIKIEKAF
jgi:hypothetical protein